MIFNRNPIKEIQLLELTRQERENAIEALANSLVETSVAERMLKDPTIASFPAAHWRLKKEKEEARRNILEKKIVTLAYLEARLNNQKAKC